MVATPTLQRPLTADDLAEIPDDGKRYEIVGGELIVSPSPSIFHQIVSSRLESILFEFFARTASGVVVPAPIDVHLDQHNVVQPDLIAVSMEHVSRLGDRGVEGSPDLVVEIVSPSSLRTDYVRKAATYATFGVPEYWIVDAKAGKFNGQSLVTGRYVQIPLQNGLLHSGIFPGLAIDPSRILAVPDWLHLTGC